MTTKPEVKAESLEDRIFRRLREWQAEYKDGNGPRDTELESDIYHFLYRELRGVAMILPGMGWESNNPKVDVSCRFTSVLNKAFVRILEKYPDKLLRAKTRSQLTGYVSSTMSNMMLNHYKRKGTFRRKIEEFLGMTEQEQQATSAILAKLTQEKAIHFEKSVGVPFVKGLEMMKTWEQSNDVEERNRARALELRYAYGLSKEDVAERMGIARTELDRLIERAKHHLRGEGK